MLPFSDFRCLLQTQVITCASNQLPINHRFPENHRFLLNLLRVDELARMTHRTQKPVQPVHYPLVTPATNECKTAAKKRVIQS